LLLSNESIRSWSNLAHLFNIPPRLFRKLSVLDAFAGGMSGLQNMMRQFQQGGANPMGGMGNFMK